MTRRIVLGLIVVLLAALTYPGAMATSMVVGLTPAPNPAAAPAGALPWLHVQRIKDGQPYVADDRERMVLLHGAIAQGLIDFYSTADPSLTAPPPFYPIDPSAYDGRCPANSPDMPTPPLCEADVAQMATFGFNSLRLPLSWSLIEPERGRFDKTYLDRIAQVVSWARAAGMYVILDMHQNAYSRYIGRVSPVPLPGGSAVNLRYYTGAPAWATITDGLPPEAYLNQRELNPAVLEANTNFWYDRNGIQDEYISAVAFLANRFKNDSAIAGYSVFNEPLPGWNLPPGFEDLLLFPFYRRVIDAITGVHDGLPCWSGLFMPSFCGYRDLGVHDLHHLFFLEAGLLREVTDFPTHLGLPVSSYPNLVLSLHAYTHQYTFDHFLGQAPDKASYPWGGYDQSYSLGEHEAKAIGAALFVSEFGFDPKWDALVIASQLVEMEKHRVGFAFWTWKENGSRGTWGMFDPPPRSSQTTSSGCLRSERERLLARVYPQASSDPGLTYRYDPTSGAFILSGHGSPGDASTTVYLPPEVTGAVAVSGAAGTLTQAAANGSRVVTVSPSDGPFSIVVASAPLTLAGC
ncbi:MAG: cellulase family glycosylhydrolase [Candidatus Dormiibacterota bacterium]